MKKQTFKLTVEHNGDFSLLLSDIKEYITSGINWQKNGVDPRVDEKEYGFYESIKVKVGKI